MIPCPACGGYLRSHKTKSTYRIRRCLSCFTRYKTQETVLYEVGTVSEERLLKFFAERVSWQSFEVLAQRFCVSRPTVSKMLNKLEEEKLVKFHVHKGRKLWQLADRPAFTPKPRKQTGYKPKPRSTALALPIDRADVVHRIAKPGEQAPPVKRGTQTTSLRKQSWFSVIG